MKDNRQFYISLLPKMAYSRGPFIDLLIKADLGNYLEFRSMEKTFIYNEEKFEHVKFKIILFIIFIYFKIYEIFFSFFFFFFFFFFLY